MIDRTYLRQSSSFKLAFISLCVFMAGCYLSPSLSFSKLIIIFIGGIAFFYFLMHRHAFYALLVNEKILFFFLFFTVLSCSWSDANGFTHALKSSLVTMLFIFYIAHFKEELYKKLNIILMTVVLSAGLLATSLLYEHFSIYGYDLSKKIHVTHGPIVQTIKTASVFTISLLVMIWNIFTNKGWQRWISTLFFFPVLLVMLLLQSRGAALALGVGVSSLYVVHNARSSKIIRQSIIGVIILGTLVSLGVLFSLEYNPKGITDTLRINIWLQSIEEAFPERALWGIGYSKDQHIYLPEGGKFSHSHNIFVSIFRFTGLIGLLAFAANLLFVFKRSIAIKDRVPEISLFWAWVATALCVYFFDGNYPVYIAPDIFLILWAPLAFL